MASQAIVKWALLVSATIWLCLAGLDIYKVELAVWGEDLAGHPDESAHFTTGVMMKDFLSSPSAWGNPVAFASNFYTHYPKVAIGHWPPVFYIAEAAWFGIFGESLAAARLLVLAILALFLAGVWAWVAADTNWISGMAAAATLAMAPVAHVCGALVLSDGLVALLCLAAMYFWSRFIELGRARDGVWFTSLAALAILTKGNAWVLLIAAFIAPALAGTWRRYRQPELWLSLAFAAMFAAPFYLIAQNLQSSYPLGNIAQGVRGSILWVRGRLMLEMMSGLPLVLRALVLLGLAGGWKVQCRARWAVCVAFCVSMVAFLTYTGLSFESRVLLPMFAFAAPLAVGGLVILLRSSSWWCVAAFFAIGLMPLHFDDYSPQIRTGYREVGGRLASSAEGIAMIVGSDAIGEGALVVDHLSRDPLRKDFVIRGSKFLSLQDANGQHYREIYSNDDALLAGLRRVPVRYVVIDEWSRSPGSLRLRRVAEAHFRLIYTRGIDEKRALVFEDPAAAGRAVERLRFTLGPWRGDRVMEYQP